MKIICALLLTIGLGYAVYRDGRMAGVAAAPLIAVWCDVVRDDDEADNAHSPRKIPHATTYRYIPRGSSRYDITGR